MAYLTSNNIITSLGTDTLEVIANIERGTTGISFNHPFAKFTRAPISLVNFERIKNELSQSYSEHDFTNFERLVALSLDKTLTTSKINTGSKKTLFILSTTKGNIELLKPGIQPSEQIHLHNTANKIAKLFGFINPPIVVCNACISGVLALIIANRYIENEKYSTVVVTGADVVTDFVVAGFESFKSMSESPCRPFDSNRDGLSLGEGAGTLIVSKFKEPDSIKLVGGASANDANHISGPSRTGEGLYLSASHTLPENQQIDFISAHGTATPYNDDMESHAINRLSLSHVPVNSFKAYFGHTLGAAGIIETIVTKQSMLNGILYRSLGVETPGVASPLNIVRQNQEKSLHRCLKLSSGFGGCNAAILLEKDAG